MKLRQCGGYSPEVISGAGKANVDIVRHLGGGVDTQRHSANKYEIDLVTGQPHDRLLDVDHLVFLIGFATRPSSLKPIIAS